jgi:hypothetical protein
VVGYDGTRNVRNEELSVGRKKKLARTRGRDPKKGIWTALKDNAALVAAIIGLFGVVITGAVARTSRPSVDGCSRHPDGY